MVFAVLRGRSGKPGVAIDRHDVACTDAESLVRRYEGDAPKNHWSSFATAVRRLAADLDAPVHCSSMAIYRMLYACCVLAQLAKWDRMFTKFSEASSVFPYPGYGWVKPLDPAHGHQLLSTCWWASLCQLLGLATPLSTCVAGLTFTWLFLICESHFNNHYILMCHMLFLGTFLGWGRAFSLDRLIARQAGFRLEPFAPAWNLMLIRIIVVIPYFFGGIAKLNSDWLLRKQPVTMWFEKRGFPYDQDLFQWCICWTGMLFDLVQPFLLFNRRTRYLLAFPAALAFNTGNKIMFNIGVFPLMMVASLVLFLEPYVPAQVLEWVMRVPQQQQQQQQWDAKGGKQHLAAKEASEAAAKQWQAAEQGSGGGSGGGGFSRWSSRLPFGLPPRRLFGLLFVSGFLLFHGLYPLRHFVLYPGNPSWHEEGHNGAWHMKLRTKEGHVELTVTDSHGSEHRIDPSNDPFIIHSQEALFTKPHKLILYVGRLKQVFEAAGNPLRSVTASSCYALNRRPHRHLYVQGVDLLPFVGQYELLGVSAARHGQGDPRKWLWQDGEGPVCSKEERKAMSGTRDTTRRYLREVYQKAGIVRWNTERARKQIPDFSHQFARRGSDMRPVVRVNPGGEFLGYAYVWDNGL